MSVIKFMDENPSDDGSIPKGFGACVCSVDRQPTIDRIYSTVSQWIRTNLHTIQKAASEGVYEHNTGIYLGSFVSSTWTSAGNILGDVNRQLEGTGVRISLPGPHVVVKFIYE